MNKIWTIGALLQWTQQYFAGKGIDSPRLDAEILLAHVLHKERIYLYASTTAAWTLAPEGAGAPPQQFLYLAPGNAAVQSLVDWYREETRFDAEDPASAVQWAFGRYADGSAIPQAHRRLYRERPDLQDAYPHPFASSHDGSLQRWMTLQGPLEYPELFAKKAPG